jgi:uncharacterized surface anchored protein
MLFGLAVAVLTLAAGAGLASARSVESLSTGVSADERTPRKEYSLLLMFAEAKGSYLANVTVEIKDAEGKIVLATTSAGPWLFAKLAPGSYTVVATRASGQSTGAAFTVGESGQQSVRLTW